MSHKNELEKIIAEKDTEIIDLRNVVKTLHEKIGSFRSDAITDLQTIDGHKTLNKVLSGRIAIYQRLLMAEIETGINLEVNLDMGMQE